MSRAWPVREAVNLTPICEPIAQTMWDPQHLTTLEASTVCYQDSFNYFLTYGLFHDSENSV
jgi:hypothetical protein